MPSNQNFHLSPITGRMIHLPQAAEPEPKPKSEPKQELTLANPPPTINSPFMLMAPMPMNQGFQDPNSHMVNFHNDHYISPPAYQGNQYTYQPSTTHNQYTYQPSTTPHRYIYQPSTTNQQYQYQPPTTPNRYTYQPSTTNHQYQNQHSATSNHYTYQPSTIPPPPANISTKTHQYQPTSTPNHYTHQPSTVPPPPPPNVSAETHQWPPPFSTTSKTQFTMSGALMDNTNNWKNNHTHRSYHPSSKKEREQGKGKKNTVHFTQSVSDREREKQQQHHQQQHHHHHHHHHQVVNYNNDNNNKQRANPPLAGQKGKSKDSKTKHKIERLMCEWCQEGAQEWFDEGVGEKDGMRLCGECYRVRVMARARGEMR